MKLATHRKVLVAALVAAITQQHEHVNAHMFATISNDVADSETEPTVISSQTDYFQDTGAVATAAVKKGKKKKAKKQSGSQSPSSSPSHIPSSKPSQNPSSNPSQNPSSKPSRKPSSRPSRRPSAQPSNQCEGLCSKSTFPYVTGSQQAYKCLAPATAPASGTNPAVKCPTSGNTECCITKGKCESECLGNCNGVQHLDIPVGIKNTNDCYLLDA